MTMSAIDENNHEEKIMDESRPKQIIEALLIATDEPLTLDRIADITQFQKDEVKKHLEQLNQEYIHSERAFQIKEIAGGYQIYTLPVFADWVGALHDHKSKLSRAALETLAVIAYHQPITRAEIEKVRGVDCTYILDALIQKGLIRTSGRLPVPGRPIRYATTREFLRYFGIKDLDELPREADFSDVITRTAEQEIEVQNADLFEKPEQEQDSTDTESGDELADLNDREEDDDLGNTPAV
jgi:segregation and condensation protein B